jgi:hypothetical protein
MCTTRWELLRADVIADPNPLLRELAPLGGWISDGVEIFVAPDAETLKQSDPHICAAHSTTESLSIESASEYVTNWSRTSQQNTQHNYKSQAYVTCLYWERRVDMATRLRAWWTNIFVFFTSSSWLCASPSPLHDDCFPRDKATRGWRLPFTSMHCPDLERVELFLDNPHICIRN